MTRRFGRRWVALLAVLAIATVTIVVASISAGAATKPRSTTTLSIGSQVKLFPGGADVTVSYSCFPGGFYGGKGGGGYSNFGNVRLGDLQGHQGFAFFNPLCNGKRQTSVVFVSGSFSAGAGAASVFICGFDCNQTSSKVRIS